MRVSGPLAGMVLRSLFTASEDPLACPRRLVFGRIGADNEIIDRGLAVFMAAPNSFTGEDTAEFQIHGSPLIVQELLRSIYALGVLPAQPGEFTKRAFLNGKLDLAQAEAVADLVSAADASMLRLAREQLEGRLSGIVEALAEPLRELLSEIEATLDFPDEEIDGLDRGRSAQAVDSAAGEIDKLLATWTYGQRVREGFRVWLCGLPNAGKSSLFNALLGSRRAIVTAVPGTTRDIIEESVEFEGCRFVLCDSAGIRETGEEVEKIGVELARSRADWADLVLLVVAHSEESGHWKDLLPFLSTRGCQVWFVGNKVDLCAEAGREREEKEIQRTFYLSAQTGQGVLELRRALLDSFFAGAPLAMENSVVLVSERHRDCLVKAAEMLALAKSALATGAGAELVSADLRGALLALEELVGRTFQEDILGRIFSKFCIGK